MAARPRGDRGAAVVDFAMISVLLVFLLMAVLQVAVFFYAKTIVASATAEAARYAAAKGVDAHAGGTRAHDLITKGLDDNDAAAIRCTSGADRDAASGLPTTTVHCRGHVRLLFLPIGVPLTIDESATVLKEGAG